MSHLIYTTEALVIDYHNFGESNRWYYLLTPDFGLVMARAQGIRELRSKLRGHLSLFALAQISLVRGREYWHLVGAEIFTDHDYSAVGGKRYQTIARVAGLLRRLLPEAGAEPELFTLVKNGFHKIATGSADSLNLYAAEVILVWHILRQLGHIEYPNQQVENLEAGELDQYRLANLTGEINAALSHSQL